MADDPTPYTPTEAEVRAQLPCIRRAGFDRFLAQVRRESAAQALRDAASWMQDGIGETFNPSKVNYDQQRHEARARRAWLRARADLIENGDRA